VTRDYVLELTAEGGAPMLSCFGGKITTYRRLAEHALDKLAPYLPPMRPRWTASAPLPGGDLADFSAFVASVEARWPFLPPEMAHRLARAYGTRITQLLDGVRSIEALGADLGGGLHTR
jgi:glycerol-3-phosphate dehydrogenase